MTTMPAVSRPRTRPPTRPSVSTSTDRRSLLTGAGLGIATLALPTAAASASTATPTALVGAEAFGFTSPGYVDLVASMSGSSGTEDLAVDNRWHLGYAFVAISIDAFRLYGRDGAVNAGNSTHVHIAVAAEPDTFGGFPAATRYSLSLTYNADLETSGSFTATTVPAGHHFLIAIAGGNNGRAYVTSAPSRIATSGGQPIVGFETGYWQTPHFTYDATTLNAFTRANRTEAGTMDRVGWRVTIAP